MALAFLVFGSPTFARSRLLFSLQRSLSSTLRYFADAFAVLLALRWFSSSLVSTIFGQLIGILDDDATRLLVLGQFRALEGGQILGSAVYFPRGLLSANNVWMSFGKSAIVKNAMSETFSARVPIALEPFLEPEACIWDNFLGRELQEENSPVSVRSFTSRIFSL